MKRQRFKVAFLRKTKPCKYYELINYSFSGTYQECHNYIMENLDILLDNERFVIVNEFNKWVGIYD